MLAGYVIEADGSINMRYECYKISIEVQGGEAESSNTLRALRTPICQITGTNTSILDVMCSSFECVG